jgi:glutathione S-transferase
MPQLLLKLFVDKLGVLALPARKIVRDQLKLHLDYLEAEFDPGPWFLGERFTAADIMLSFPVEVATARAGHDETRQRLKGFLRRNPRPSGLPAGARTRWPVQLRWTAMIEDS